LKAWHVGGKSYIDIDDAVEVVVSLVGDHERAIYESTHKDANEMIFKEARADLLHMVEGDTHDFMGILITVENIPFGF
jgi:hypothetical protein